MVKCILEKSINVEWEHAFISSSHFLFWFSSCKKDCSQPDYRKASQCCPKGNVAVITGFRAPINGFKAESDRLVLPLHHFIRYHEGVVRLGIPVPPRKKDAVYIELVIRIQIKREGLPRFQFTGPSVGNRSTAEH